MARWILLHQARRQVLAANHMDANIIWLVLALCIAGAAAGFTSGLFGNGGGFVVVPALTAVFPLFVVESQELVKVAIGTSLASIVISSARSLVAHNKKGAVDFKVLKSWSAWIVLGALGGILIANNSDSSMLTVIFAGGVLFYSVYFLFPTLVVREGASHAMPRGMLKASFAFVLGGFSALLGIGGGTPMVITMTVCRRTIQQAVATAAGVGVLIGLPGTIGFLLMEQVPNTQLPFGTVGYINLPALFFISIGSILTAPIGVKLAHHFNETRLKRAFGVYLVIVSFAMFYKYFNG